MYEALREYFGKWEIGCYLAENVPSNPGENYAVISGDFGDNTMLNAEIYGENLHIGQGKVEIGNDYWLFLPVSRHTTAGGVAIRINAIHFKKAGEENADCQ